MRSIGLMGGTFDPIHIAHLIMAEEVRAALNLSEMVFIPAAEPPHKAGRHKAAPHHRLAMVELAIASNPHFSISLVELDRPGPSYLVDTLRLLRKEWGTDVELSFVIGWDSLEDFPDWYQPAEILAQLKRLVVVRRPGYEENPAYDQQLEARLPGLQQKVCQIPFPQLDISSTDIRRRIAEHRPIKYQVPEAVEEYILTHNLYQTVTESQ
ncbi:putative nicotinate-nucleotide adenylyltransferase [Dictyobacter alpinus]|uniref:Probable nicotinate-nucleotide adenylyltransferase n=1 Tax=Dictyobacter alpinus TaxID=2014873 RepID=A0A402B932_9CHLR|nr:nicotinate-nucleotide adenylyltransferase [Dictyobacter alpinus]GCE27829.1 putative nicotinate-nucleotide adenylyltransferase [Dictyobacter alpinus]